MNDMRGLCVLFIANGVSRGASGFPGVSGGDVIAIKIAKRWNALGLEVHILSTPAGIELCKKLDLNVCFHELPCSSSPTARDRVVRVLNGTASISQIAGIIKPNILVTSCEHLYDVLPAFKMKTRYPSRFAWASIVHFVPARPTTRRKARLGNALLYFANHYLGALLIRQSADLSFGVSPQTVADYERRMRFSPGKIHAIPAGIDLLEAREALKGNPRKEHDGLFLKRVHPMKGVYDAVVIWKRVVNSLPQARLVIAGGGDDAVVLKTKRMIAEMGLEKNVDLLGPVYDAKSKYSLLARSKVLLLPSYEENWAIVVGEALGCELPVVAYDLKELRTVWGSYISYIPVGDTKRFADKVTSILRGESPITAEESRDAVAYVSSFDWDSIADKVLSIITAARATSPPSPR
jgi:glycosyltransferase involved in cell wall biosynthesis